MENFARAVQQQILTGIKKISKLNRYQERCNPINTEQKRIKKLTLEICGTLLSTQKYYNGSTRIRGKKGGVPLIDTVVKRLKVNTKKEILEPTRGEKKNNSSCTRELQV